MSLIDNKYIVTEGVEEQRIYSIDDLSSFRYEKDKYGCDTVELQAFSKSQGKFVPITWYDHRNYVEEPDLRNNYLIKSIFKAN